MTVAAWTHCRMYLEPRGIKWHWGLCSDISNRWPAGNILIFILGLALCSQMLQQAILLTTSSHAHLQIIRLSGNQTLRNKLMDMHVWISPHSHSGPTFPWLALANALVLLPWNDWMNIWRKAKQKQDLILLSKGQRARQLWYGTERRQLVLASNYLFSLPLLTNCKGKLGVLTGVLIGINGFCFMLECLWDWRAGGSNYSVVSRH